MKGSRNRRHVDKMKYPIPYQDQMNEEEKLWRIGVEGSQGAQRKEAARVTGLSGKVGKLTFEERVESADPFLISFCEKYPQYIDDLATELYIQARVLYDKGGNKMDTTLTVNMAHVISKLPVDSPTRKRCQAIYDFM